MFHFKTEVILFAKNFGSLLINYVDMNSSVFWVLWPFTSEPFPFSSLDGFKF